MHSTSFSDQPPFAKLAAWMPRRIHWASVSRVVCSWVPHGSRRSRTAKPGSPPGFLAPVSCSSLGSLLQSCQRELIDVLRQRFDIIGFETLSGIEFVHRAPAMMIKNDLPDYAAGELPHIVFADAGVDLA